MSALQSYTYDTIHISIHNILIFTSYYVIALTVLLVDYAVS